MSARQAPVQPRRPEPPCPRRPLIRAALDAHPRLARPEDLRALQELELLVAVTPLLSFGTTCSVLHDTRPPTGVRRTDLRLYSTVRLTL